MTKSTGRPTLLAALLLCLALAAAGLVLNVLAYRRTARTARCLACVKACMAPGVYPYGHCEACQCGD